MTDMILSARNLTKRFGPFSAVLDVSFDVARGEIFSLLGPNGAGKTTTIRMIMGILQPTAGNAAVGGLDCFTDRVEVMRRVGYLPDEPVFYDYLRGRELLRFVGEMHGLGPREIEERAGDLVEQLDLGDALEEFAVNYSRGMKKKLALACALLHEPELLILDEPTSGLDPGATRTVLALLKERVARGASVFFSTHLLDQAERISDRVAILFKARLALLGPLAELRAALSQQSSLEEIFFAVTQPDGADAARERGNASPRRGGEPPSGGSSGESPEPPQGEEAAR